MKQYEVTFIVDPVLSGDEIKATAKSYEDMLKNAKAEIVHVDDMGLRQLAYPIRKRSSGVYFCIEYKTETAEFIEEYELAMRRDDRIMRCLTVRLDRHGIKYNEDKRNGKIAKAKRTQEREKTKVSNAAKERTVAKKTAVKPKPARKAAAQPKVAEKTMVAPVATKEEE